MGSCVRRRKEYPLSPFQVEKLRATRENGLVHVHIQAVTTRILVHLGKLSA